MAERTSLFLAQLSAADRKLLQISVHLNPLIVANADGKYSFRESSALATALRKLISDEEYRPLVLVAGHEELSEAAMRVMLEAHTKDIEGYLKQVAELLATLPEEVAEAYRQFTVYAIITVAEASRDGLFGLVGDRISASEKTVMRRMVDVLELPLDDDARTKLGM